MESNPQAPPSQIAPPQHIVDLAVEVSGWSPCRSKRGVVIFDGEHVVSRGHNDKPTGFTCDGSAACKATCRVEAVHAEQDALLHAGHNARGCDLLHVKSVDGRLVASGGPSCVQCSKLIARAGIARVWLYHESGWRRYEAQDFHRQSLETTVLDLVSQRAPASQEIAAPQEDTLRGFIEDEIVHATELTTNEVASLVDDILAAIREHERQRQALASRASSQEIPGE